MGYFKGQGSPRTLLLENALLVFVAALCANLKEYVSLEYLLRLLFKRSAACLETDCEISYLINTRGLYAPYKHSLVDLIDGINAINLHCRGKPIRARIREAPTCKNIVQLLDIPQCPFLKRLSGVSRHYRK